jgi:hypothetical protein
MNAKSSRIHGCLRDFLALAMTIYRLELAPCRDDVVLTMVFSQPH